MNSEELVNVLKRINNLKKKPLPEELLENMLSIVIMNPLEQDRTTSQDQIRYFIEQKYRGN